MKVLGVIGSLSQGSVNRKLMNAFLKRAPEGVESTIADIGSLPLYNQDLEAAMPESALKLKAAIESSDVVVFATPEYNRTVPGPLLNAIDWSSRPYGHSSLKGKLVAVIGASSGPIGTAPAQYHLKQTLLYLDTRVIGQPEFFMGVAGEKFDESGELIDEKTTAVIDKLWGVIVERSKHS